MANDNIFQQYLAPPKSVLDYSTELDQADARKQSLQQNALALAAGQQKFDEAQQANQRSALLRAALSGLPAGATDDQRIQAMRATGTPEGYTAADALGKSLDERRKSSAAAGKDEADTADKQYKLQVAKHDQALRDMSSFQSPQDALASLQQHVASGEIPAEQADLFAQQLRTMSPADFPKWQLGMIQRLMSAKDAMSYMTPDANAVANNERIKSEGAANRAVQMRGQDMADARARDQSEMTLTHGIKGLTPEQNDALFGENGAVTTGRLDPNRLNSRTAGIFADAEMKRPGTDFSKISGDIALGRNATFRQNAMTAEVLPEVMQNMVDAGKKIGFSDNRTIGKMQGWVKGEFNDPDMTEYMTQRNDALMTVARVMRGAGMTDMAHKAETEVSSPTMSPAALDAWLRGQMKALQPRLDINRRITRDGAPSNSRSAGGTTINFGDLK